MQPYTFKTGVVLLLIGVLFLTFHFIPLPFAPFLNIVIKCSLITIIFIFVVIKLKLSSEINQLFYTYLG